MRTIFNYNLFHPSVAIRQEAGRQVLFYTARFSDSSDCKKERIASNIVTRKKETRNNNPNIKSWNVKGRYRHTCSVGRYKSPKDGCQVKLVTPF